MSISLKQIRKEYNNSISEIPDRKLKELYDSLYYEAYHSLFIEGDNETYQKALKAIDILTEGNTPWKVFRASQDAIINVPMQVLIELLDKADHECKNLKAMLFTIYLGFLKTDTSFLSVLINYINEGFDEKRSLEFIREQMVKVRDEELELLRKNHDLLNYTINHYESKKDLSHTDLQSLELLKDIKEKI